mgnify:FL=1
MKLERRDFGFCEIKVEETSDKVGTLQGYGAVFGNVDSYGDVIERGAFAETLKEWEERGKLPPMLLQHGGGFLGSADDMLPIGKWTKMREDRKGLWVEGELFALDTERGRYIYEGLKAGVLDGLSIGFMVRESKLGTKPSEPARTLTNIDLWEVSIVTFPANPKARVTGVKAFTQEDVRLLQAILRDEGFSHKDTATVISGLKKLDAWRQRDVGVGSPRDVVLSDRRADERMTELLFSIAEVTERVRSAERACRASVLEICRKTTEFLRS